MFKHYLSLILIILTCLVSSASASQLTGRDVMVMENERYEGENSKSVKEMILINKRGKQRIREVIGLKINIDKDNKKVMYFRKPYDVKGTAFLSWEYDNPQKTDDKWLYMPALRKTKRISGESENEYFMGTDFTYDDLGDRNVDEDIHTLKDLEKINEHECYVVESVPVDKKTYYSLKKSWISKDSLIVLKCEYFDKNGLIKTYTADSIKLISGIWTADQISMINHRENHRTIIKTLEMEYNTKVEENLFTVSSISRGMIN
jgi:outer membrane lipoprotein-sorting protein